MFFLLACPFVSRVASFIYDVRVRGVVLMFNELLILSLCGVVREHLLPCCVIGLNGLYHVHRLCVSSLCLVAR